MPLKLHVHISTVCLPVFSSGLGGVYHTHVASLPYMCIVSRVRMCVVVPVCRSVPLCRLLECY